MKSKFACVLAALAGLSLATSQPVSAQGAAANEASPQELYQSLRTMALTVTPGAIGLTPASPSEPYAVLFEMDFDGATATIVSFATGDASIYFSNGGGILGSGQSSEKVADASRRFVRGAEAFLPVLARTSTFPQPRAGQATFYIVTESGVYGGAAELAALSAEEDALSDLYFMGHDVITEIRLHEQSKE